jgi:antibiotic biosynthesis monooxygenase (ABM) superfamily enzyme
MAMIIAARPTRLQLIYLGAKVARSLPATEKTDGFSAWFLLSGG